MSLMVSEEPARVKDAPSAELGGSESVASFTAECAGDAERVRAVGGGVAHADLARYRVGDHLDFERIRAFCESAEALSGETVRRVATSAVLDVASRVTSWQWVIHGDTAEYRRAMCEWMMGQGQFRKALRFASCGRGDIGLMEESGSAVRVRAVGCGCRFCPRCSRRMGLRALRRVRAHIGASGHGDLIHMVLTHEARLGESLADAKVRFEKKFAAFRRSWPKCGVSAAMVTFHVKWSSAKWWHYHAHVVFDLGSGGLEAGQGGALAEEWQRLVYSEEKKVSLVFWRKLASACDSLQGFLDSGQGEFWSEASDAVSNCLSYAIRDVVQGCESWVAGLMDDNGRVVDFAETVGGAKLHRLYGTWRKKVEVAADPEAGGDSPAVGPDADSDAGKKGEVVKWLRLGSVNSVILMAMQGILLGKEWLLGLDRQSQNRGAIGKRLRVLLRQAALF